MTTITYSEDKDKSLIGKGCCSQRRTKEKKLKSSEPLPSNDSNDCGPDVEISDEFWTTNRLHR